MNITKHFTNRLTDLENNLVVTGQEREVGWRHDKGRGLEVQTTMYKINKLQGSIVQNREYSQQFIITLNGV